MGLGAAAVPRLSRSCPRHGRGRLRRPATPAASGRAKAETQDTGRELIAHMGCYGCHTINYPAYTGLRKAGPSLPRIAGKTNPGWAYKWIEAPRDFHPTTWMPHFFYQENTTARGEPEARSGREIARDRRLPLGQVGEAGLSAGAGGRRGRAASSSSRPWAAPAATSSTPRPSATTSSRRSTGCTAPTWCAPAARSRAAGSTPGCKNPKQYFPDTNMPNLRLTDQEAADVAPI